MGWYYVSPCIQGRHICWLALVLALATVTASGQECEGNWQERRLEPPVGVATETALSLDIANNAFAARVVNENLKVTIIGPATVSEVPLDLNGGVQGDPSFATSGNGVTFISFSQRNSPASSREVYLTKNSGGSFGTPENLSNNGVDDYGVKLALDASGKPHLTWAQTWGQSSRIVYWNSDLDEPEVIVENADSPDLFVDVNGFVHFAFTREKDIVYVLKDPLGLQGEKPVTSSPFVLESSVSVGADDNGSVMVAYESSDSLYVSVKSGSSFKPQTLLDAGGVVEPRMLMQFSGKSVISYAKDGDIFYVLGQSTSLDSPRRVTETPDVESQPSIDADSNGNLHATYIRGGLAYYANNACAPTAAFTADVTSGRLPSTLR